MIIHPHIPPHLPRLHGVRVDSKGYLVIKRGKFRDMRVHRFFAMLITGRKLERDEVVHHKDGNKLNWEWGNLEVLGEREHNAVSAKQRWWLKQNEIELKKVWDEYFDAAD